MRGERGSASLAVVAVSMLAMASALVVLDVARVVDVRIRAQTAADAAALAAAVATYSGDPVREAGRFAALNGARLTRCRCPVDRSWETRVVEVSVAIGFDRWLLPFDRVEADARAEYQPVSSDG